MKKHYIVTINPYSIAGMLIVLCGAILSIGSVHVIAWLLSQIY